MTPRPSSSRRLRRAAAAILVVLAGCGDDDARPLDGGTGPPPGVAITWNQSHGGIGVDTLAAVWGASPQHILALHSRGILRYDGIHWTPEPLPASFGSLTAIWGAGPGAVFAVGAGGTVLAYDGSAWNRTTVAGGSLDLTSVWGTAAADVYAVGAGAAPGEGVVLHHDGAGWSVLKAAIGGEPRGVWASAGGGVVVVGDDGFVLRRTDGTWIEDTPVVTDDLFDVWGASADEVRAVGADGRIIRWDGTGWTAEPSGTQDTLRSIRGRTAGDIDAVGVGGTVLHYNGSVWSEILAGTVQSLHGVAILSPQYQAAVGERGTIVFGYGSAWTPRYRGEPLDFEAVWSTPSYYMAVGSVEGGGVARDRDGFAWQLPESLHAVAGFGASSLYAVGHAGAIYNFDGFAWTPEGAIVPVPLRGITALVSRFGDPFRMYVVGDDGTILVWRGTSWSPQSPPGGAEQFQFVDVWAAAIDDVFAVARNSTSIVRYDDPYELGGWTLEPTPAAGSLLSVGGWQGDVYAVSALGEILYNGGSGWQVMPSPATTPLRDVRAISQASVFAVGDGGTALHYDGVAWRRSQTHFYGNLLGVSGRELGATFAVGVQGAVLIHEN